MAPIRLRHIHLPSTPSDGIFPSYKTAAAVQELLRRRLLDFKDAESSSAHPVPTPHPTLISFTPQPTYTLGRRQAQNGSSSSAKHPSSLTPADIARLKAPLRIRSSSEPKTLPALGVVPTKTETSSNSSGHTFNPSVMTSPRGGLATYHGPGQVVLWPVMVISGSTSAARCGSAAVAAPHDTSLGYKSFTVRCYSRLLENTTTALLHRLFGLSGFTTDDPGVWVRTPRTDGREEEARKISALGIHLRRHVSSLGAAINLDMPTTRGGAVGGQQTAVAAGAEGDNPWERFVACGLEGKGVTCVAEELRAAGGRGVPGLDGEVVARAWAEELARGMELNPAAVERVGRDEVEEIVGLAKEGGFVDVVSRDEI